MIYEKFYKMPDGEFLRRVEIQTSLTTLEQVAANVWAPCLRRW